MERCDIVFDDAPKKATSIHAKAVRWLGTSLALFCVQCPLRLQVLAPTSVRLIDLFTSLRAQLRVPQRRA